MQIVVGRQLFDWIFRSRLMYIFAQITKSVCLCRRFWRTYSAISVRHFVGHVTSARVRLPVWLTCRRRPTSEHTEGDRGNEAAAVKLRTVGRWWRRRGCRCCRSGGRGRGRRPEGETGKVWFRWRISWTPVPTCRRCV